MELTSIYSKVGCILSRGAATAKCMQVPMDPRVWRKKVMVGGMGRFFHIYKLYGYGLCKGTPTPKIALIVNLVRFSTYILGTGNFG